MELKISPELEAPLEESLLSKYCVEWDASKSPGENFIIPNKAGGAEGFKYAYHPEHLDVFPECFLKCELVDRELMVYLQPPFPVNIFFRLTQSLGQHVLNININPRRL